MLQKWFNNLNIGQIWVIRIVAIGFISLFVIYNLTVDGGNLPLFLFGIAVGATWLYLEFGRKK